MFILSFLKGELLVILVLNNVIVFTDGCQCKEGITFYYSVKDQKLFLAKNCKMFINNAFPGDFIENSRNVSIKVFAF